MPLLLLVLVAGCGRFAFESAADAGSDGMADGKTCAAIGHDEDGDGVDDACDVCPHLPGMQIDGDGDGVGDACDPNPSDARERIVFFDPYTTMRSEWEYNNAAAITFVNDQLSVDARGIIITALLQPRGATEDVYAYGGSIAAGGTSGQRQLTLVLGGPNGYYYCEIYGDNTATAFFNATYTPDNINFFNPAMSEATGPVANRTFRMELHSSPTTYGCVTTWPAVSQTLSAARPAFAVDHFNFAIKDVEAKLDYFIQIHSD